MREFWEIKGQEKLCNYILISKLKKKEEKKERKKILSLGWIFLKPNYNFIFVCIMSLKLHDCNSDYLRYDVSWLNIYI